MTKPRWIVRCAGLPTESYTERMAETEAAAVQKYFGAHQGPLGIAGGFICVTDCETGRERRFRCRARGPRRKQGEQSPPPPRG